MRTKVLVCAAAVAAAGAFTSVAQNVYSLNVVGYINIPLVEGFNLIANQLDFDGTGTNNTTSNVLGTNVPLNSAVYTWSGSAYNIASFVKLKGATAPSWNANYTLNPGQGAWLSIPAGGLAGTSSNLITVGQVDQGGLVNPNLIAGGGYSLVSSMVPLSGGIQTVLGYTPLLNDSVYQWSTASGSYVINSYVKLKGQTNPSWSPAEPSIGIGEGFWLNSGSGAVWSNYFTVQ
jgi:hypothetical protein